MNEPIFLQIKKVEMANVSDISYFNTINANSCMMVAHGVFTDLNIIGLASVKLTETIQNKQRIYNVELTGFREDAITEDGKAKAFIVTTITGERYIIGDNKRPYAIFDNSISMPSSMTSKSGNTFSVIYSNTHSLLKLI